MTRLAAFGDFAPLAHSASLARASPVTRSRITIVAGNIVHVHPAAHRVGSDRPVPVATSIVVAPLNLSLTTMTVQQFHRSADSLRTRPVWLASSPASTLRVRRVRSSPVTGFRITPSSGVLATAGDPDDLLRTSAVTAFIVPRRMLPTTPITTAPVHTSVSGAAGAR